MMHVEGMQLLVIMRTLMGQVVLHQPVIQYPAYWYTVASLTNYLTGCMQLIESNCTGGCIKLAEVYYSIYTCST